MQSLAHTLADTSRKLADFLLGAMFEHRKDRASVLLAGLWVAALYLIGLGLWFYFLNGGSIQLELEDWAEISGPRYAFLRDAVTKGVLPLHMSSTSGLRNVTDRFISVPDTNISPQVILLRFMDVGRFVLIDTLLVYSLGFLGTVALGRKLRLSPVAFTAMMLLLMFNGHIEAHLAVGHASWIPQLLVPWVAYLVLVLLDGDSGWRWTMATSFLLFFIMLQGGLHFFVQCAIFLALTALADVQRLGSILRVLVCSLLMSSIRVFPAALEAGRLDRGFLSGFPSVETALKGTAELIAPIPEQALPTLLSPLGWWEFDYYVGMLGVAFLLCFGIGRWFLRPHAGLSYSQLKVPILAMSILAVGKIYKVFHILEVPLLSSQRVGSRFLFVPLAMLVIMAAVSLQRMFNDKRLGKWGNLAVFGLLVVMAQDLWQHLKLWRVANMGLLFAPVELDLSRYTVANHPDPPYAFALTIGLSISLATMIGLTVLVLRERAKLRSRQISR